MKTSARNASGASESPSEELSEGYVGGFSGKRAAEIADISYRQLDYWARTNLIRPSVADAQGSGSRRRYSYRDWIELRLEKTLLDHGNRLESVRAAFDYLRAELGEDIPSGRLVIAGKSAVLVRGNEDLVDVVNRYSGQGVFNLNLVDLDGVREEIDAAIVELFPGPATTPISEATSSSDGSRVDPAPATRHSAPAAADR